MNIYTNYNYDLLPLTLSSGTPVNLYYQPMKEHGVINLWPKPNDTSITITIRYQAPFEDIDEAKFNEMSKVLSEVDLTKVVELDDNTDLSGEVACAGGNCEVV